MSNWSPVEVSLSGMDFAVVESRAIRRVDKLSAQGQPRIVNANIMGLLGELAVLNLLKRILPNLLVSDVADDPSTPSDLEISTADDLARRLGIEIKTTSFANWYRRGRVIGMSQFESTDALAYVWCTTAATPKQDTLFVMGWLPRAGMRDHIREQPAFHPRPSFSRYAPPPPQARRPEYDYDEDDFGYDSYGRDDLATSHDPEDHDDPWSISNDSLYPTGGTRLSDQDALLKLQTTNPSWEEGNGGISWRDPNQVRVVGPMNNMGDLGDWLEKELQCQNW